MHSRNKHNISIIRTVALILFLLYIGQVFNNTFYLHTHVLAPGKVITHAHPYNKSNDSGPVQSHKHTWDQIITLENLEILFPVFFLLLTLISLNRKNNFVGYLLPETRTACVVLHKSRAPPLS